MKLLDALFSLESKSRERILGKRDKETRRERKHGNVQSPDYGRTPDKVVEKKETLLAEKKEVVNEPVRIASEELVLEHIYELKSKIDEISKNMTTNREGIEEKIHSENVKAYRNYQATLDELDKKMAKADRLEKQVESLRVYLKCTTWFSITTLIVLVAYILYSLGVF